MAPAPPQGPRPTSRARVAQGPAAVALTTEAAGTASPGSRDPTRLPARLRAAILEIASRWWRRRLKLRPQPSRERGGGVTSLRRRRTNPEVRLSLVGVWGRRLC